MAKTQNSAAGRSALEMLAQDHKRVQKLFKDFEKVDRGDADAVRELVETACLELQIHSMLEEEIFYPAVRAHAAGTVEDLLNEAEVEHESVDELIAKLHELEADDPMYCAYFTVLGEYVKHHVKEEEQALFPQAAAMQELNLKQLGEDMRLRREELFAEMERRDEESEKGEKDEKGKKDKAEKREPSGAAGAAAIEVTDDEEEDVELEDEVEQIDISRTRH